MSHINLIPGDQGVRLSTLSPKYLHTNSTSHTWPFSAVAELIDNAYDPDVDASQLFIDVERFEHEHCLTFTDNGAGMDSLKLHKMLSFGFCEKVAKKDHMPVGHYGNGFKSGSMRLGKSALIFTQDGSTRSVGFLSQTYLEAVKAETILVPIVTWDSAGNTIERSDGDKALRDILKYSMFKTCHALLKQFDEIHSQRGTRIIISKIRRTQDGKPEFDFRTDFNDIRVPDDVDSEVSKFKRQERQNHIPESDYSLRAYCSILYLRPRMQIILRSKKVRTTVIAKSLSKTEVDLYKPQGANKALKITFGFSQNRNHYGIMMYHRNRLIKPYVRVGYQLRANNLGVGVIGVIQCDFLQPTHNKQDFDYTKMFRSCMSALGTKLNDYWTEKKGRQQTASNNQLIPEPKEVDASPDQLWVQCDNPKCLKWRKLPTHVKPDTLPDKWYCLNHPLPKWQSCDALEELEDEKEEVQPYIKKQKKRLEKELEERKRREKESKAEKEREFEMKTQELKKKEVELQRLIQTVHAKGNKQKEFLQKQVQRATIKNEVQSPQKLQVKLVGPVLPSDITQVGQKRYIAQHSGNQKVFLTPASTSSPQKIAVPVTTKVTTPMIVKTISQGRVVNQVVLRKPTVTPTPIRQATPVQQQPGVKIVNVMSPGNYPRVLPITTTSGTKLQLVSGYPAVQQVVGLPKTPVSSGGPVQVSPKVVAVRSLSVNQAQAITSQGQTKPIQLQVKSPNNPNVKTIQVYVKPQPQQVQQTAQTPRSYQPLESLIEVNKHAAETSISPVSAVIADAGLANPSLGRQAVTINERYRYIVPSSQAEGGTMVSPTPAVSTANIQYVSVPPQQVQVLASQGVQPPAKFQVKKEFPVISQSSASSTGIQISQVQSLPNTVVASSPAVTVMIKKEPEDLTRASVPGLKRLLDNTQAVGQPPRKRTTQTSDNDVIVIDPPSPPRVNDTRSSTKVIPNNFNIDVDKEIIETIASMSEREQFEALATRTQHLYALRENVCKLLRVLVPELEVDDKKEIVEDTTIDELLGQVLEQAIAGEEEKK